jgi:hypothetical protein
MSIVPGYAELAMRAIYGIVGHAAGGLVDLVPIEGRGNPNVLDLEEHREKRARQKIHE